jgi:serine protease Do
MLAQRASGDALVAQAVHQDNPLAQLSASTRALTRRVSPAVVEILVAGYGSADEENGRTASQVSRQSSSGSGVLVDSAGYIMTNAHVVRGAISLSVLMGKIDGAGEPGSERFRAPRTYSARVLGVDRESDLALLKVEGTGFPWLRFGNSDTVFQGDLVLALGSPMRLRNSLSMGVVSAPARAVSEDDAVLYIQTDASINPGDSGGALVNTDGRLVGLNTFIMTKSGGNEGIGFAIPSAVVQNVYRQLRLSGVVAKGSLGAFVQNITPPMAKGLDLQAPQGVLVSDIEPQSPAEAAGLKRRDVILSLDNKPIETARQFDEAIYRRQIGDKIVLRVQRAAMKIVLTASIAGHSAKTGSLAGLVSPEKNLVSRLGIFCVEIDKEVAEMMPELRRQYGLIVAAKAPEGQIQFIDLRPGDIIHAVNNRPIALLDAFRAMIGEYQHGAPVALQIERDGRFQYVAFEIE